jgi:hypothetical protein
MQVFHSFPGRPSSAALLCVLLASSSPDLLRFFTHLMMVSSRLTPLLLLAAIAEASTHGGIYANSQAHAERAARLARRQDNRTFTLVDSAEGSTFFEYVAL